MSLNRILPAMIKVEEIGACTGKELENVHIRTMTVDAIAAQLREERFTIGNAQREASLDHMLAAAVYSAVRGCVQRKWSMLPNNHVDDLAWEWKEDILALVQDQLQSVVYDPERPEISLA